MDDAARIREQLDKDMIERFYEFAVDGTFKRRFLDKDLIVPPHKLELLEEYIIDLIHQEREKGYAEGVQASVAALKNEEYRISVVKELEPLFMEAYSEGAKAMAEKLKGERYTYSHYYPDEIRAHLSVRVNDIDQALSELLSEKGTT